MGEFEGTTVMFDACTEFRASHDDLLLCDCGWLEDDHVVETMAIVMPARRLPHQITRPQVTLPERRAS